MKWESDAQTQVIPVVSAPRSADPVPAPSRTGRIVVAFAVVVLLVGAGAVVWRWRSGSGPERATQAPISVQHVALVRQDLWTSETMPGKLGYGAARPLTGNRPGTVTWLPAAGSRITRGKDLLCIDDKPVPLFYGAIPMYRTIAGRNLVGRDVRIVANNLQKLGYPIGYQPGAGESVAQTGAAAGKEKATTKLVTVRKGEGVLTADLITAVKKWQADIGLAVTGSLAVGDVVVLSGAVRVDSLSVQPGAPADGPLLAVTLTDKVISVAAEVAQAGSIRRGDRVTVKLPGEKTVPGEVSAIGTAAKTEDGQAGEQASKVTITVTVDDPKAVSQLDSADVEVLFAAETHKNVLVAPLGALLALSEGGYAVQTKAGGLVKVETGLFAKGLVEISGAGLDAGTEVVTTS
ncbi:efflux RND transporter periplasmic adaptor subunit [Actinoplanes sp. NPDC051859]|uniref:efflux RND transporter periplasmic adaptor subunit n=1 Tax=Actinoplanes sp. NPDC051859 TaxID=3363909 RepID=UPI0037B9273F